MNRMFEWVPWFTELGRKIADGGEEYLNERAKRVRWHADPVRTGDDAPHQPGRLPPLFGMDPADPLGFFGYLAWRSTESELEAAFLSVGEEFELANRALAENASSWDLPRNWHLNFHYGPQERDQKSLWTLFRQAREGDSVDESALADVLPVKGIGLKSLTNILFLINPKSFLPLVDYPEYLDILKWEAVPRRITWKEYLSAINSIREWFPGCEFYEVELFARMQRSENVGGQNLRVRPDRSCIVTTNASWETQVGDQWREFRENHHVRTDNAAAYPTDRPERGDIMLVRFGQEGRGIGVVYENDYTPERRPEERIHVLWLNTKSCRLDGVDQAGAFAEATEQERAAFRAPPEYAPTWQLLDRIVKGEGRPDRSVVGGTEEEVALWSEFLDVWSPDRVRDMSLDEYTNLNRDDAFVYWLEKRTELLGSIWGGSAFKFGVYRRADTKSKGSDGGRVFGAEYAWLKKYGETAEQAFATVRSRLTDVIDAAAAGKFEAIDEIDFSPAVKWKVAFLYQKLDAPKLLAIYSEDLLREFYENAFPEGGERTASQRHAALIEDHSSLGGVLDISRWLRNGQPVPPPRGDRNVLLYGPPGTGKTYATVGHALKIIDGRGVTDEITDEDKQRFRELRFMDAVESKPATGQIAMVTFHQNYAYEDFVEGIRPRLAESDATPAAREETAESLVSQVEYELRPGTFRRLCEAAREERRAAGNESRAPGRFVLIIDEINRGNIPKIFGELITLIEDSRRLGEGDATTVTLPYSGDEFGVPKNLYIIGTMNTADRSIQQLDTALRRRFTFVEMMPDPDHALIPEDVEGVNCRKVLQAMNERIALLLDRERQIGHTYLFNVKTMTDLADRFRNRIFPLLQEYFYDDWRKVRAVLGGNAFVTVRGSGDGHVKDLAREFDLADDETVIYARLPLDDSAWRQPGEYRAIYENVDPRVTPASVAPPHGDGK